MTVPPPAAMMVEWVVAACEREFAKSGENARIPNRQGSTSKERKRRLLLCLGMMKIPPGTGVFGGIQARGGDRESTAHKLDSSVDVCFTPRYEGPFSASV
jgi:hypothetical protein